MAVQGEVAFNGQQRLDVQFLREVESGVAADFDALCLALTAGQATVVRGFAFSSSTGIGSAADNLTLKVAGGLVLHREATDPGTVFLVPDDRTDEVLNATNARVRGSFTPGVTNYVGLDFQRKADATTTDTVQFLDPTSGVETPRKVPLRRTADYTIVISTIDFDAAPGICPVALVVTNTANQVTAVTDARQLQFRLGTGGSHPDPNGTYAWPGGRTETQTVGDVGGDRSITSQHDHDRAVKSRIWEIAGGEHWYSQTADRNVQFCFSGAQLDNAQPFKWTDTNVLWTGISLVFDNSTGRINEVQDQTVASPGLTDLADGECIYVDLDRSQDRTVSGANPLVARKGVYKTLGGSAVPGNRYALLWRLGARVYARAHLPNVISTSAISAFPLNLERFGSGGDGSATIAVNTDHVATKHYQDLTIATGITLDIKRCCPIYVRGTLNLQGTAKITCNASGVTGGGGGGTCVSEGAGDADGVQYNMIGHPAVRGIYMGGANSGHSSLSGLCLGGAGGAGTPGSGGARLFNEFGSRAAILKDLFFWFQGQRSYVETNVVSTGLRDNANAQTRQAMVTHTVCGGAGGNSSGAAGGGVIVIFANRIILSKDARIQANASSGGTNGGGGGVICLITNELVRAVPTGGDLQRVEAALGLGTGANGGPGSVVLFTPIGVTTDTAGVLFP